MSYFADTNAKINDSLVETLKKILQVFLEGAPANPMGLYADDNPSINDSLETTAKKILDVINGGGVGGTPQVYTGASPPAAPDDPTLGALYYPTGGGTLLQWDTGSGSWV